ncbi:hypothetical protein [Actinoplanes sp. NPDC049118]|uniref:hypothetical protein n=1 Tax=Actinoplanes sp. NPDC049118 TaxID=3155769 RepID=UPI0033C88506
MEPTSEPDHNRQSRGLARFWPVHGAAAPAQRQSDEDPDVSPGSRGAATAPTSDQQAGAAGPTGEHPQVSDQQSQPQDDHQESDEPAQSPFAPGRPHPALTSDTQMVALGSRRPADALLGSNGSRWSNQVGFPQVETNGHRNGDAGPRHGGAPIANGQAPAGGGSRPVPGSRSPFAPGGDDAPGGPRSPFIPADDAAPTARSPFAPAEEDGPADAPFAPSPFAPQASGSAPVSGPLAEPPAAPAHPLDPATPLPGAAAPARQPAEPRPVSAQPAASGTAQVPAPRPNRPVSAPPAATEQPPATRSVPHTLATDNAPTRLEPTGWATAGPRAGASGSATVPVSPAGGRRSRDDDDHGAPAPRRAASLDDAAEAPAGRRAARAAETDAADTPLRPGDVHETSITFWEEAASEQFRAEWHEIKAQFVDDPVAALTRAHDLLTEAVHELTESMLAERDDLDPLRGSATPDTESMRMAMRGYREFLDRILAL